MLGACSAPGRSSAGPGAGLAAPDPPRLEGAIPPEHLPALEALEREVLAGDDLTARAILRRILARGPDGATLELARGFERILDGREAARGLDLALVAHETPGRTGRFRLELLLRTTGEVPLVLRPGPSRLVRRLHGVDAEGGERRSVGELPLGSLGPWRIEPRAELRVALGEHDLPQVHGALAVRATFELAFLAGEVRREGRTLPVRRLEARPAVHVLLSGELPPEAVDPGELARYVSAGRVHRAAALERAVRVPPADYRRALQELAVGHARLNRVALEELLPALRWLAGEDGPVGGVSVWWAWLGELARGMEAAEGTLDMPAPRR